MASALVNWTNTRADKLPLNALFPGLKCYIGRASFSTDDYDQSARPTAHSGTTAGSTVTDAFPGLGRIRGLFPFTFGSELVNDTAGQATGAGKLQWTDSTDQLKLVNGGLTGASASVIDEVEAATDTSTGPLTSMTFECLVMGN